MAKWVRENGHWMEEWFSEWTHCDEEFVCQEKLVVVEVGGIPIKAWNNEFFRKIGNFLGRYAGLTKETARMGRLDRARVMVALKDRSKFPKYIVVNDNKSEFKVETRIWKWIDTVEEEEFWPKLAEDTAEDGKDDGDRRQTSASGAFNANTVHEGGYEVNEATRARNEKGGTGNEWGGLINEWKLMLMSGDVNTTVQRDDVVKEVEMGQAQKYGKMGQVGSLPTEAQPKIQNEEGQAQMASEISQPLGQRKAANGFNGKKKEERRHQNTPQQSFEDICPGKNPQQGNSEDEQIESSTSQKEGPHVSFPSPTSRLERVLETQMEGQIPESSMEGQPREQNKATDRGICSAKETEERNTERRMVVFGAENNDLRGATSDGVLAQGKDIALEDLIKREVRLIIGESKDLGISFKQQGETLEKELMCMLQRVDRHFRHSKISRTRGGSGDGIRM